MRFNQTVVVALGVAVSTLCAQAPESANRKPAAAQEKHWGYEGGAVSVGPAKWGTLAGDATCSTGKQQTPINLSTGVATPQDLPNLVFGFQPSSLSMTNNGHTVQMTYEAGSSLGRVGGPHRVDARTVPLPRPERAHRGRQIVPARNAPRFTSTPPGSQPRGRRGLHPGRPPQCRARASVPEPACKGRRQG